MGGRKEGHYKEEFRRCEMWGRYCSFIPLTSAVENVTLKGFKYPLTGGRFVAGGGGALVGISNEVENNTATIETGKGILIVAESGEK